MKSAPNIDQLYGSTQYEDQQRLTAKVEKLEQVVFWGKIGVAVFLFATFSKTSIEVDYDSPDVFLKKSSFWGFSKERTPIVWRESAWMTQDKQGRWHVAIEERVPEPPEDPRR